jgi:hypothetical protein
VPTGAADGHWVRCPICGAEYRLSDLQQYESPVLELIDPPAVPAEGRVPQWGAVAAGTVDAASGLAATAVAAPAGDLPEIEMLVPPPAGNVEPFVSADVTDDTEVITFDDSLLLDEPTDALPGQGPPTLPANVPPAMEMSDDDFFKVMSGGEAADNRRLTDAEFEGPEDDTLEPYEFGDVPEGAAPVDTGADAHEAVTAFEPVEAENRSRSGDFGFPPRRRSRRGNPIVMGLGVIGGGVLGLAIGYAILMWGFSKDPFALGPKLPDVLVPAALRSTNDTRVVQYAPADKDTSGGMSDSEDTSSQDRQSNLDDEPLFPLPGEATTRELSSKLPTDSAVATDSSANDLSPGDASLTKTIEPKKDDLATETDSTAKMPGTDLDSEKSKSATVPYRDPLANPFGDLGTTEPKIDPTAGGHAPARYEAFKVGPTVKRSISAEELMTAVGAARPTTEAAVTLPANAELAKRIAVNREYYSNLAKVAEALAHFDRGADSPEREKALDAAIGALLDAVPTSGQLAELGKLGGYWFANPDGEGIVLAGLVKDSKPSGKLIASVVQPLGKPFKGEPPLVTVISLAPLTDDPSRPVLVAGTIVNQPTENLRGYEGSAAKVVWSAIALDPTSPRSD